MKRTLTAVVAILAIAPWNLAQAAPAKRAAPTCPYRYSLVEHVCVSDSTGDIVLPAQQR